MSNSGTIYTAAVIGAGKAKDEGFMKGGGHRIGYTHGETYRRNKRTRLVAVADINAENLRAYQESFDLEQGFADYRKMLAVVQPDIVSICTYVGLHRQMIVDACQAGVKGIICEKPFLSAPVDLGVVAAAAATFGTKIVVPHMRRYFPAFARAKDLYAGGEIGEPLLCIAGIPGWDLSEWGSHWLDMFRFFHDDQPVEWVFGQARVRDQRGYGHAMEDHAVAYFGFVNGGKAILDGGMKMAGEWTMTLVGTSGTIRIRGEDELVIQRADGQRTESYTDHPRSSYPAIWDCLLVDLIAWLDGGAEPMLGLTNMLKTSELNLAAYMSALRGDRIDLPLVSDVSEWPVEVLARRQLSQER
ncbi:MAG: Gfo/Idh/MocA family oxidoreductase [Caldilinea sp.]|nr:Gfo/Idh/MocA family oxidoreductase [Caldilinea sp.]